MSTQIRRPDNTVGAITWTSVGGTPHAVLADNANASYVRCPQTTGGEQTVQDIQDWVVTTGAQIRSLSIDLAVTDFSAGRTYLYCWLVDTVTNQIYAFFTINAGQMATSVPANGVFNHLGPADTSAFGMSSTVFNRLRLIMQAGVVDTGIDTADCRVYEARVNIVYNVRPTTVVTGPSEGSTVTDRVRPDLVHTFSDVDGDAQEKVKAWLFSQAQYSATGFDYTTSPYVWYSGELTTQSLTTTPTVDLADGNYRVYKEAADAGSSGNYSLVDFNQFTIAVDRPVTPTITVATDQNNSLVTISGSGGSNRLTRNQSSFETDNGGLVAEAGSEIVQALGNIREIPVLRGTSTVVGTNVTTLVITPPTGMAAGDRIRLISIIKGDSAFGTVTPIGGTGFEWTHGVPTKNDDTATGVELRVSYKIAEAGQGNTTVNFSTATDAILIMIVVPSAQIDNSVGISDSAQANASSVTVTAPSIATPGVQGSLTIMVGAVNNATANTMAPGDNMTELLDIDSGGAIAAAVSTQAYGDDSATGTRTMTASGAGKNVGVLLSFPGVTAITPPHALGYARHTITAAVNLHKILTTPTGLNGLPVTPGSTWTALMTIRMLEAYAAKTCRLQMRWYKADGSPSVTTPLSETASTVISEVPLAMTLTATAPADAAFLAWGYEYRTTVAPHQSGETNILDKLGINPGNNAVWTAGGFPPTQSVLIERTVDNGVTWEALPDSADPNDNTQAYSISDTSAPRGVQIKYRATMQGTVNGLATSSGSVESGNTVLLNDNHWWLKMPSDPTKNRRVKVVSFDFEVPEPQGVYRPIGRTTAVVTSDGVKSISGRIKFRTKSVTEYNELVAMINSGETLLLQDVFGRQWYVRIGDKRSFELLRATDPSGVFTIRHLHEIDCPFVEVGEPS